MNPRLDESYFDWLHDQVCSVHAHPRKTYLKMLEQLFTTEFVWFIPNDDNRAEDGRELRREFLEDVAIDIDDPDWVTIGCSMLEMFIALSRRLAFQADGEPRDWFWHLVKNAGLDKFNDKRFDKRTVEHILERIIWRTYHPSGHGGLFPLERAQEDQRDVELWYQLSAYLLENQS